MSAGRSRTVRRHGAGLLALGLLTACATAVRTPELALRAAGADASQGHFQAGDTVYVDLDLAGLADRPGRLTGWDVIIYGPPTRNRLNGPSLLRERVDAVEPLPIGPEEGGVLKYSFVVTPEMAEEARPFRISIVLYGFDVRATASFTVESSDCPGGPPEAPDPLPAYRQRTAIRCVPASPSTSHGWNAHSSTRSSPQ